VTEALTILVSLSKGKGDSSDPNNYRGISAEDLLTKLMSMILTIRLYCRCELLNYIAREQYGFRSRMRSTDALLSIVLHTKDLIRKKDYAIALFFDFMKAFDTVSRDLLFSKLERYGVIGKFKAVLQNL
jgi:hypothetical protein